MHPQKVPPHLVSQSLVIKNLVEEMIRQNGDLCSNTDLIKQHAATYGDAVVCLQVLVMYYKFNGHSTLAPITSNFRNFITRTETMAINLHKDRGGLTSKQLDEASKQIKKFLSTRVKEWVVLNRCLLDHIQKDKIVTEINERLQEELAHRNFLPPGLTDFRLGLANAFFNLPLNRMLIIGISNYLPFTIMSSQAYVDAKIAEAMSDIADQAGFGPNNDPSQ